jgi:Holliday junction resolvase RusA-like endonuclease
MAMIPPTVTHQEKEVAVIGGKPVFFEPPRLKEARAKLEANLAPYAPEQPYAGAVRLVVKWRFPIPPHAKNAVNHYSGEYKTTKPDTDNLQKLLKDVMTRLCFWTDDALVASEIVEKFWADKPGIYIAVTGLDDAPRSEGVWGKAKAKMG